MRILTVLKTSLKRREPEGQGTGRPFLCFFLFDVKRKKASSGDATPVLEILFNGRCPFLDFPALAIPQETFIIQPFPLGMLN